MTEEINYPYLPEGRTIKFVPLENEFMQAAKAASENSGCSWWPTSAVIVKDNQIIGTGANEGNFIPLCPRVEHDCPTGTGYEYCHDLCEQKGHAEVCTINNTLASGNDPSGADLYLFGHWWCCENCWKHMIDHGIRNVYLPENSHKIFTRENRLATIEKIKNKLNTNETLSTKDAEWELN